VKKQQLLHSFLPSVTLAVLTTQSAWARTAEINGQQLDSQSVVVYATKDREPETIDTNRQISNVGVDSSPAMVPISNLSQPTVQSFADPTIVGKTLPVSETRIKSSRAGDKCLNSHNQSQAALLLAPSTCNGTSTSNAFDTLLAQSTMSDAPKVAAPAPMLSQPSDRNLGNAIPASTGSIPVPEQLNHDSNPLTLPTRKEEVTLKENQPITLAQALELAKRNNNDLQVTILQLEQSKFALRQAQAALFPTLGVTASIANSRDAGSSLTVDQERAAGQIVSNTPSNSAFTGQAQLSYNLYSSGQRKASIRQAEEQIRYQELAVETKSEDIRLNVATAYYNLQQADEQVRINNSAVVNAQASLRDAVSLERAGVGTKFDVLTAQVNLANAQQNVVTSIGQQEIARRQLATLLNTSEMTNLTAAEPVQLAGLWQRTLEQSIILAYQNRPELQEELAQRNIYEQQRRQALSALGPQVNFVASYSLEDIFNDHISASDGYSVGLQATLNLYDGGAAKAKAAQAKSNILITETQFSEQRNQIRFQVEQAYFTERSNLDNVQTANVALDQAKEALRLARLRFQAGVGTQTDVINSENSLTTAEGNRVKAILNYNIALTQLQRYVSTRALSQ
jgi:outer membrane protein TolC